MTPGIYKSRPQPNVVAMQWDGSDASAYAICEWVLGRKPEEADWDNDAVIAYSPEEQYISVVCPYGPEGICQKGDYIVRTDDGVAVLKQDVFESLYERSIDG